MKAAHQRRLRPGTEYERHFDLQALEGTDPILADGDTYTTIREMEKWIRRYQSQTATLAPVLQGPSLEATCRNIWEFAYRHFQYREDKDGVEQLRSPLRAWKERTAGIDCDCYTILISTILLNLRIPHKLRKAKYKGGADFQHIYVVVPRPGTSRYFTIDPVLDQFNQEEPYSGKYDLPMLIQGLNGTPAGNGSPIAAPLVALRGLGKPALPFGSEFQPLRRPFLGFGLSGLGTTIGPARVKVPDIMAYAPEKVSQVKQVFAGAIAAVPHDDEVRLYLAGVEATSNQLLDSIRDHFINTRNQIAAAKEEKLTELRDKITAVLNVWHQPELRDQLIALFSNGRVAPEMANAGLASVAVTPAVDQAPTTPLNGWLDDVGDFFSNAGSAVGQAAGWVGNQASTAAQGVAQAATWAANGVASGASGAWTGISNAATWVGNGVANGASAAWDGIKQAGAWIGEWAVKIGKLLIKFNPLAFIVRQALKLALRVNLFWMSERLGLGLLTEAEASQRGLNIPKWRVCKDRMNGVLAMWDGLQGDAQVIKDAVKHGYNNASAVKNSERLAGLGEPATAASTAAASGFIGTICAWLKDIDWKSIYGAAKSANEVVQTVAKFNKTPTVSEAYRAPLTEEEYNANRAHYDTPPQPISPLLIGLGVAAGVWGISILLQ